MEHKTSSIGRTERIKRWLIARRHVKKESPPAQQALLMRSADVLLGWALCRAPLAASVNPLAAALLCALPRTHGCALLGVLFALWQGAPHPELTLLCLGAGLSTRLLLHLYAYPEGADNAKLRRQRRQALWCHLREIWHQLGSAPATDAPSSPASDTLGTPLPVSYRVLSAAVAGVAGGVVLWARGGFSAYDLWGALLFVLLTPLACTLFCFSLDAWGKRPSGRRALVGHAALLVLSCLSLRSVVFFSLSVACVLLMAAVLILARRCGLLAALGSLLLGGVVLDLAILPPYLVTVILYALLAPRSTRLAWLLAPLGGAVVTLARGSSFFYQLAPSLLCGFFLASALLTWQQHAPTPATESDVYRHDGNHAALLAANVRNEHLSARLCAMSGAFNGLCEVLLRMGQTLRHHGDNEPQAIQECRHAEHFAKDCAMMAGLMRDAMAQDAWSISSDDESATALGALLREHGAHFKQISCLSLGNRCSVQIHGCTPGGFGMTAEQLHRLSERATGMTLRAPVYDGSNDGGSYLMQPRPRLTVRCTYRSLAAGDAPPLQPTGAGKRSVGCGDSIRFFSDGQDRFYALLCDGMGSGEQAALTSGISVLFLERTLRAGVGMDTALTLLNHYLSTRDGALAEMTSTVDLLSLDLFNGKARFIKSGAAETLILRDGQLYSVSCRSFPLGILSGVDVQIVPFSLQTGDCILMMSDGVGDVAGTQGGSLLSSDGADGAQEELPLSHTPQESSWLYAMLTTPPADDAAAGLLLDEILRAARAHGSPDDMTVALLQVVEE